MIIGILGILFDITMVLPLASTAGIVDMISNGLLIVGAAMANRFCLLPSIIIGIMINIVLWILVVCSIFGSSIVYEMLKYQGISGEMGEVGSSLKSVVETFLVVIIFIVVLIAVIHVLVIRVIFAHFDELRVEEQHLQHNQLPFAVTSNTFVSHSNVSTVPATVYAMESHVNAPSAPATSYASDLSGFSHK